MLARLHHYATWALTAIALLLLTVCVLVFVPMNYSDTNGNNDYTYAEQLYEKVRQVPASDDYRLEITRIIRRRLDCYANSATLHERISECMPPYTNDLVTFSRDHIHSSPLLGLFVNESEACPMVDSIWRGTENLSEEECVVLEEQCIEFMLDKYWRGSGSMGFFK